MGVTVETSRQQAVLDSVPTGLYIDGAWEAASGGATLQVEDPSTGEHLCQVADATPEDGLRALAAADRAQQSWAGTRPQERADILQRCYDAMMVRRDDLALIITLEMGKPLAEAYAEVDYAAGFIRWFAGEAVRVAGRYSTDPAGTGRILVSRQPVGPCVLVTPWNFPIAMGARKIAPALAAGCTTVIKPAQQTPLATLALASILEECGLPAGVLNVVTTRSAGRVVGALLADRRTAKLSFTGSTEVGRGLLRAAADQVLRVSMELGGNAPFLVLRDADVEAAVEGAVVAKMRNMGQSCVAANRFLVHESLAEEFSARLAQRMAELTVGRGVDDGVQVGPLIDGRSRDGVAELVADATDRGAVLATGGAPVGDRGYFYAPTVLTGVPGDARLLREEIFGPVAPVVAVGSDEEAVRLANETDYGLAAYVYTRDLRSALLVMERLRTGMVGINQGMVSNPAAPFGGVKHSGLGREGGPEGIDEYLETKYAAIAI